MSYGVIWFIWAKIKIYIQGRNWKLSPLVASGDLFYGNFDPEPDLPDRRHVAGAAVVLRSGVGPEGGGGGGGAAGRAAAEPAEGGADRGFVVEDEHWPAVGSQGVVHVVHRAEQDTAGGGASGQRNNRLKSLRLVLRPRIFITFYFHPKPFLSSLGLSRAMNLVSEVTFTPDKNSYTLLLGCI